MSTLQPDQVLGGYKVTRLIGRGGMGEIYLARQLTVDRDVALKILSPELVEKHPQFADQFISEARAAGRFNHPNIIAVHDVGQLETDSGQTIHYFSMEYIDGDNFHTIVKRNGRVPLQHLSLVMEAVTSALVYAGEIDMVHRDIKPDNIMISRDGRVKLADFGLAMSADTDEEPEGEAVDEAELGKKKKKRVLGTPHYMSPEQARGRPLDPRSDLYSLGATCFHMLTGEPPYDGDKRTVMRSHIKEPIPDPREVWPECPPGWARIVMQLMAKEPGDRFQTAQALLNAIKSVNDPAEQGSSNKRPRTNKRASRRNNGLPITGLAVGGVLLLAVAIIAFASRGSAPPPANEPNDNQDDAQQLPQKVPQGDNGFDNKLLMQRVTTFVAGLPDDPAVAIAMLQGTRGLDNPDFSHSPQAQTLLQEELQRQKKLLSTNNAATTPTTSPQADTQTDEDVVAQGTANDADEQEWVEQVRGFIRDQNWNAARGSIRKASTPDSPLYRELNKEIRDGITNAVRDMNQQIADIDNEQDLLAMKRQVQDSHLPRKARNSVLTSLANRQAEIAANTEHAQQPVEAEQDSQALEDTQSLAHQQAADRAREALLAALGSANGDQPNWRDWRAAISDWRRAGTDPRQQALAEFPDLIVALGDDLHQRLQQKPYEWQERNGATMTAKGWEQRGRVIVSMHFGRAGQGGEAPTPLRSLPFEDICAAAWKFHQPPAGLNAEAATQLLMLAWQLPDFEADQTPQKLATSLNWLKNGDNAQSTHTDPDQQTSAEQNLDQTGNQVAVTKDIILSGRDWRLEGQPIHFEFSGTEPSDNLTRVYSTFFRWRSNEMEQRKYAPRNQPRGDFNQISIEPGQKLLVDFLIDTRSTLGIGLGADKQFTGLSMKLGEEARVQFIQADRNGALFPYATELNRLTSSTRNKAIITYAEDRKVTVKVTGAFESTWTAPSRASGPLHPRLINLNNDGRFNCQIYQMAVIEADKDADFQIFE
jgi:serine/threonine protein kinase